MKCVNAVLLMEEQSGQNTCELASLGGVHLDVVVANDLASLERAFSVHQDLLLSFGTGVIVPSWILEMPGLLALNVHAASPQYPGRDPHHFAVYDGARQYGATMHHMTKSVDAGPIVDVELFDVPAPVTPSELLARANDAGWSLIARFFQRFSENGPPTPMPGLAWGPRKTTRKMFQEMCRIDPAMSKDEIERRLKATAMPGYGNLYLDLHGHRFRIEDAKE